MLSVGALGVVFGDIGTSPLYALRTAFSMEHNAVTVTTPHVYGVLSMVLWTVTLIVTVKYVLVVLRADNHGQGGILALVALLRRRLAGRRVLSAVTILGMIGAALFYGDAAITPAISVLSAVEGLTVVWPQTGPLVVPATLVILGVLFAIQPFGTGKVGVAFGPIMLVWFATLALLGLPHILAAPQVFLSLSPHWAISLIIEQPLHAFILMSAVVLTVTGAEALYADLGHFDALTVRRMWFFVVMPSLIVVYLGQGALVISTPAAVANPLMYLAPPGLRLPVICLATLATVIASQAVISGTFSATHQAIRLGLLPQLTVHHTSERHTGQIYLPVVNWIFFLAVVALVLLFPSSAQLAHAYGLAVTGTLVTVSSLFVLFAWRVWGWSRWKLVAYGVTIGALELVLFAATTTKFFAGGWLPLVIAIIMVGLMATWQYGHNQVIRARQSLEQPLPQFLGSIQDTTVTRVPGIAVFPHPRPGTTPLAMVETVTGFHVLHEHVIIVRIKHVPVPHVAEAERLEIDSLGSVSDGIVHVTIRVGFMDRQNIPDNLALSHDAVPELMFDFSQAHYFLSALTLESPHPRSLRRWRQQLFITMKKNQSDPIDIFHLPPNRTITLSSELHI